MTPVPTVSMTNGLPDAPDAGTVTCSRYVPGFTRIVIPGPLCALSAAVIVQ
jgi:hypothetical protein